MGRLRRGEKARSRNENVRSDGGMRRILLYALGAEMGGAARHLKCFLPELAARQCGLVFSLMVRESMARTVETTGMRVETVADVNAQGWSRRLYMDLLALPYRLRQERYGAVVSLTNAGPIWCGVPHVLFQRNPT